MNMTNPVPQDPDQSSIRLGEVRARAADVGISADMLTSYRSASLLARPDQGRSPIRAVVQLDAIAAARRWTRSHDLIRHAMWWGGVPLEDFELLREQWAGHVGALAQLGEYARSLSEEARDQEAQRLAMSLAVNRQFPFPRRQIVSVADRESFAALMVGLIAGDLQTVVFDEDVSEVARADPDGGLLLQAIRKGLGERVDLGHPMTIGELIAAGFRADSFPDAGVWMALLSCHWTPSPEHMCGVIASMGEERAAEVRDFIKRWVPEPRFGIDLERSPEVAAMLLVVFDRMTAELPSLLEINAA